MTRYFCTYFDRNFLIRGLALYRSLVQHVPSFVLWVLCFDAETYDTLHRLNLPDLRPIPLPDFEQEDLPLQEAKQNRSRVEFYFTCTPSLPLYVLDKNPEIDVVSYLDADLFFYGSPEPIFTELGEGSVLICEHRFPANRPEMLGAGIYNVGFLTFRNSSEARECLHWWRARCLEWCYDRMEEDRFADQKYLNDWPVRFADVVILQNKGAGLAPWNWMNYDIRMHNGQIRVDGFSLIFFHFHGLKIFNQWLYDPVAEGRVYSEMPLRLRWLLYPNYVAQLKAAAHWLRMKTSQATISYTDLRTQPYDWRKMARKIAEARLMVSFNIK